MDFNIKVIFGMKLKHFREQADLSLTDFAARTGLSTSYLTEIEHGKKYPKAEKIVRMAESLGKTYDDLVSMKLDEKLSPLAGFLSSPVLHNFPYHLFGMSPAQVVELMTRQPDEASALVKALVGIAEQYNIGVEHLFRSALRSYQELNGNYFPGIERAVSDFVRTAEIGSAPTPRYHELRALIEGRFNYRLDDARLASHSRLHQFRSVLIKKDRKSPILLINPALSERQKKFILAREIGYQVLELKERAMTSAPERVDSFEQVLNDFKASYFAGALLIGQAQVLDDIRAFFALSRWQPDRFLGFLEKYEVTPEILMYRLTEVLPEEFGIRLHFLRFNHEKDRFRLVKHLNMSEVLIPGGTGLDEHYCRRWLALRILDDLERLYAENATVDEPLVDGQVSQFINSEARFLCIALARRLVLSPTTTSSVSLGFRYDDNLEKAVSFARDPALARTEIDGTCERCPLSWEQCKDRVAPPDRLERQRAHQEIELELASLQS